MIKIICCKNCISFYRNFREFMPQSSMNGFVDLAFVFSRLTLQMVYTNLPDWDIGIGLLLVLCFWSKVISKPFNRKLMLSEVTVNNDCQQLWMCVLLICVWNTLQNSKGVLRYRKFSNIIRGTDHTCLLTRSLLSFKISLLHSRCWLFNTYII